MNKYLPIKPGGYVEILLKALYCLNILGYNTSKFLCFSNLSKLVTIRPEQGFIQFKESTGILFTHSSFCSEQIGSLNIQFDIDFDIRFIQTFCEILKLEGRHLHCAKTASRYFLVVQLWRGSIFWHFLTSWSSPRYESVASISFKALRLYSASPIRITGSKRFCN